MEVEQPRPVNPAMTFDEVSMERSKGFVNALQELKNLRPQLYSAAEYCEKTFLHNEQKQMVLDNLKDYAIRALVNVVDHLGTVGYKLNDLLEQQTLDVSTMELQVTCLNQQLCTCQTYIEKEGLRQQQLLAIIPKHHKHYILPSSVSKKVHFGPLIQTDTKKQHIQAGAHLQPSSSPASKTLSWHLESATKPTLKGASHAALHASNSTDDTNIPGKTSGVFHLIDNEAAKPLASHIQHTNGVPASDAVIRSMGLARGDGVEGSKNLTAFRSFDNANRRQIVRVPARSKSVLSAFFVKPKSSKLKAGTPS